MSSAIDTNVFQCELCQQQHELALSFGFSMPDFVNKLLPWDREKRCQISPDWCIVDEKYFYLRGCLIVPVQNSNLSFSLGLWTTVSEENFDRTMHLWEDAKRELEPAYEGALANSLPFYDETRNLPALIKTQAPGNRPLLVVADPSHRLHAEQQSGMPMETARQFTKMILHSSTSNPWEHLCER